MSRLFVTGCSYTALAWWPTWADVLSNKYNEYENWGIPGIGNRAIFNRLNEMIYKKSINKNDTVVVQWSLPTREDRYFRNTGWLPAGNIYTNPFYQGEFIEKYWDVEMSMIEMLNYVHASRHILTGLNCRWAMCYLQNPIDKTFDPKEVFSKYFIDLHNSDQRIVFDDIESFKLSKMKSLGVNDPLINGVGDPHPSPIIGYYYLTEKLIPVLGIENFDSDQFLLNLYNQWTEYLAQPSDSRGRAPNFSLRYYSREFTYPHKKYSWC